MTKKPTPTKKKRKYTRRAPKPPTLTELVDFVGGLAPDKLDDFTSDLIKRYKWTAGLMKSRLVAGPPVSRAEMARVAKSMLPPHETTTTTQIARDNPPPATEPVDPETPVSIERRTRREIIDDEASRNT